VLLDRGKLSALRVGRFSPREGTPVTGWGGGGHRAGLGVLEKRKVSYPTGDSNPVSCTA
jgi:hypothetical protein